MDRLVRDVDVVLSSGERFEPSTADGSAPEREGAPGLPAASGRGLVGRALTVRRAHRSSSPEPAHSPHQAFVRVEHRTTATGARAPPARPPRVSESWAVGPPNARAVTVRSTRRRLPSPVAIDSAAHAHGQDPGRVDLRQAWRPGPIRRGRHHRAARPRTCAEGTVTLSWQEGPERPTIMNDNDSLPSCCEGGATTAILDFIDGHEIRHSMSGRTNTASPSVTRG